MTDEDGKEPGFYDVAKFLQENQRPPVSRSRLDRVTGRVFGFFESSEGFWLPVLAFPLVLLVPFGILFLGLKFGPIAFWSAAIGGLGLGSYVLERKLGKHIVVEDFPLLKRGLLLLPAFLVILAFFVLLFFLTGRL